MTTTKNLDYYKILGIPRDADLKAIKKAFKHQAMQYHPDRNKASDAEQRFKEVAEADAELRLRGKGLPGYREPLRGDLLIRVRVVIPEKLTTEERKLYEKFRTIDKEP